MFKKSHPIVGKYVNSDDKILGPRTVIDFIFTVDLH